MSMHSTRPGAGPVRSAVRAVTTALLVSLWAATATAAPSKVPGGIRFTYEDAYAKTVAWAGAFNDWNATAHPMKKDAGGLWSIVIELPPGAQEYKFVVDGQWVADPENSATAGEFGNSVVQISASGDLVAVAATSNTPYSAKILVGGRVIGDYQSIRNAERERFELRRPDMNIDLDFGIRISEVLRARFLTNIRSETEDVEFYRSRLNFDRGNLDFQQKDLRIFAYDNDDAGTTDDPLHLVGNVGIYHHAYGFGRQGFRLDTRIAGVDAQAHYADNFEPGSEIFPDISVSDADIADLLSSLPVVRTGPGSWALASGGFGKKSVVDHSDRNEDMTFLRLRARPMDPLRIGLLGRTDRGYNLGQMLLFETTGPDRVRGVGGRFDEQWYAFGGEARWEFNARARAEVEYLRGGQRLSFIEASFQEGVTTAVDSTGPTGFTTVATGNGSESVDLETSNRFVLRGEWSAGHGDITLRAGVEYEDHDYEIELDGVENRLLTWRFGWDRNWRYYLNREVTTSIDLDFYDFDYDLSTPWDRQFWFAPSSAADPSVLTSGNFWLEHDEHAASYDRFVMLGGEDVVSVSPKLHVPLRAARNVTFDYAGIFHTTKLGRLPRYVESTFQFGIDLSPNVRLTTDTRWVKYDDPLLGLFDGFVDHFAQVAYAFAPNVRVELSYGVNPYELDPATNEFARVGRDQFLFDANRAGAAPGTAVSDYLSMGQRIQAAELAMRDERRVQVRGIVSF